MMTVHLNGDGSTMLKTDIQRYIQPEIFDNPIVREAMLDIEDIYKIEGLAFYSRRHGVKSPESLSNGMKALILCSIYDESADGFHDLISNACMGANCGKYLQRLSLVKDFSIAWDYFLDVEFDEPLCAIDFDTKTVFNNGKELTDFYAGKAGVPECI